MPPKVVYKGKNVICSFEMDRKGIAKVAMGRELGAAVAHLVEHVAKPFAIAISPRSTREHQHFQDSFSTQRGTETIAGMRRRAAYLFNSALHAAAVEWGNERTGGEGHRVLGRTLDHLNSLGHERN